MDASFIAIIAAGLAFVGVIFLASLPREEDWLPDAGELHPEDMAISETSPADHFCSDPPTTGGVVEDDDAASFIQSEWPNGRVK